MNAKAIRPYLFWIVCGVVLLAEIVAFLVIAPTVPGKPDLTPAAARSAADAAKRDLDQLVARANETAKLNGGPTEIFDPDVPAQRNSALNRYFTTASWVEPLKQRLQQIQGQKSLIAGELEERSKALREPILADANAEPDAWGYEYASVSGRLVRKLVESGLLAQPAGSRPDAKFFETDRGLRDQISLYTTDGTWPRREEHAGLALRFRVVQRLTEVLAGVSAAPQANAGLDPKLVPPRSEAERVRLNRLAFQGQPAGSNPRSIRVQLDLEGTPNALIEAMRAIDDLSQPITIRVGTNWERMAPSQGPQYDEPRMRLTCDLVILDFAPAGKGA